MTSASETECKFDGQCPLCESADVVLEFDDGSTLRAHSFILCAASPVLETALKECENSNMIRLRSVSREVWTDILREFYPVKSVIPTKVVSEQGFDALMTVGQECAKYDIESVLNSVDEIIVGLTKAIPQGPQNIWDERVNKYAKLATDLELPDSMYQISTYVVRAMAFFERNLFGASTNNASRPQRQYGADMAQVIRDLYDVDDPDLMKRFSLKMLRDIFKTNV